MGEQQAAGLVDAAEPLLFSGASEVRWGWAVKKGGDHCTCHKKCVPLQPIDGYYMWW